MEYFTTFLNTCKADFHQIIFSFGNFLNILNKIDLYQMGKLILINPSMPNSRYIDHNLGFFLYEKME